jgi:hypothetical protein
VAAAFQSGDSDFSVAIWRRTNKHNFHVGTVDERKPIIMCLSLVDGCEALRCRGVTIGYGHEPIVWEQLKRASPSPALAAGAHDANIHTLSPWDGGTRRRRV